MRTTPRTHILRQLAAAALVASGLVVSLGSHAATAAENPAFPVPYLDGATAIAAATPTTVDAVVQFIDKMDGETGYEIFARVPTKDGSINVSSTMVAAVPGTGSTARRDIRGLKPGTEYCFSVRAYKLAGSYDWSAKSNERCITMPAIVWPLLSLGANGESVRTVQYLLRQHGADVVVDGDYGPQTRAAVTAFNVANGIGKSALPGSQRVLLSATWEKLIVPVQQGSQGEAVRAVQSQLASRGMGVVVDGDFGPQTAQAVKTYQQQRGLAADGIVSAAMWSALVNLK